MPETHRPASTGFENPCPLSHVFLPRCEGWARLSSDSMARAKTTEPSRLRSKTATVEDLTRGARELQELLAQMGDLGREGFPYLDAARARTELQFRECIRRTFGEKSPEFQEHRHHRLLMDSPEETRQSIALIKALMATLEQKIIDPQGGHSPQETSPSPPASAPSAPARPPITVVPASISTVQVTMPHAVLVTPPPVVAALTPNLDLAPAAALPSPHPIPPLPSPPPIPPSPPAPLASPQQPEPLGVAISPLTPSPRTPEAQTPVVRPIALQPVGRVAPEPQQLPPQAAPPAQADVSHTGKPPQPSRSESESHAHPISSAGPQPTMQEALLIPQHQPSHAPIPVNPSSPQEPTPQLTQAGSDPLELVKAVCCRFHAVVQQLRLRGEHRATLQVDDEVDAQDLLHALLRVQFNNIDTEEWTPSYSSGAPRTTLLLNERRLAVIVKKTRPGLTAKDLTDQLRVDAARYRFHGRCTTLLCFIYDPDGRIGGPQGLEASLTSVSDSFVVDVLVVPK